jgi:hypothetical protein
LRFQIVDFPRRDDVEVGLHHDGEQGLVDPSALLEQRGEERPLAELGDLGVEVAGRCREDPGPGAVPLGGAVGVALESIGTDVCGGLHIDEFLLERFGRKPDSISDMGEFKIRDKSKQGRLV